MGAGANCPYTRARAYIHMHTYGAIALLAVVKLFHPPTRFNIYLPAFEIRPCTPTYLYQKKVSLLPLGIIQYTYACKGIFLRFFADFSFPAAEIYGARSTLCISTLIWNPFLARTMQEEKYTVDVHFSAK